MKNEFDLSWFDLSKYDAVKDFDGYEWFLQLQKRRYLKKWINEYPDRAERQIEKIKETPLSEYQLFDFEGLAVSDATYDDFLIANKKNSNAKDLYDVLGILLLNEDGLSMNNSYELSVNDVIKIQPYVNTIKQEISSDRPILSVDLNVSDEQLINGFKRWLQEKREGSDKKPRSKMFTANDFNKWGNNKILQYLDLTLIASFADKVLTQHFIGNLLFPDDIKIDVTDRIRKVVKPLANSLLQVDNLSVLRGQRDNRHKTYNWPIQ
jgi:hypothetical protein